MNHSKKDLDYMITKENSQTLLPNPKNILEKEITNSRDHLCCGNINLLHKITAVIS
jgi:hypothetical protein